MDVYEVRCVNSDESAGDAEFPGEGPLNEDHTRTLCAVLKAGRQLKPARKSAEFGLTELPNCPKTNGEQVRKDI
jgi:hypothetical protein